MVDYIIIEITKAIELGSLTQKIQEAFGLDSKKEIYMRENKLYVQAPNVSQNIQTINNLISAHNYTEEMNKLKDKAHEFTSINSELKIVIEALKNIGKLTELEHNSFLVEYKKLHKMCFPDIAEKEL